MKFHQSREMHSTERSERTGKPDYDWINRKFAVGVNHKFFEHICPGCFAPFWTDADHYDNEYTCPWCGNTHTTRELNTEIVFMEVKTRYRGHS